MCGSPSELLELLLHLLQRHLLPLEPVPVLEEIIRDRDHREHRHRRTQQPHGEGIDHPHDRGRIDREHRLHAMALRPQQREHHAAEREQLEQALAEIGGRLLAENPLQAGRRRDLAETRHQRLGRPHQPVLQHVAGDRRDHQHQQRHAERADQHVFEALAQLQKAGAVDLEHPGVGDQVAQRHLHAADRSRKRRQHQRGAGDHEPGIDLLALGDIATLKRLVETFLGGVFCFIRGIALVGHRSGFQSLTASNRA